MAAEGLFKMSLLAQYDDLCRNTKVLTSGVEEEFKIFVENQLYYVRKWKKTHEEIKSLRIRIADFESKTRRLEIKINHLKNLRINADASLKKVKWEKKCLESTIAAVKDIIVTGRELDDQTKVKLTFLNNSGKSVNFSSDLQANQESEESLLSLSHTGQADDELENYKKSESQQSWKERSRSNLRHFLHENKLHEVEEFLYKESKETDQQRNREEIYKAPHIPDNFEQISDLDSNRFKFNDYKCDISSDSGSSTVSRQFSLKHIDKNHHFVRKTIIKSVKCLGCGRNIGYLKQSLKCESCGISYHPECKNMCSVLCFPIINAPDKGAAGTVADYTSSSLPMIPPLIVHCVREIQSRGMKVIGLYRVPCSLQDVRTLIEKFVSDRIIPSLNDVDIYILCGAVKEFLRSLREPLVTHKSWRSFVEAANLRDSDESSYALLKLINDLPQANRDTLSFLILHWQNVAQSLSCKMDVEILSKVLGPIVVGHLTSESERANIFEESTQQFQVMKRLLSISAASWQSVIGVEMCQVFEENPEDLPTTK